MTTPEQPGSRRDFLKQGTAAVAAASIGFPAVLRGAGPTGKLKIGFIGCGGRGTGAANQALSAESDVVLWSMGDVFQDKIDLSLAGLQKQHAEKVDVPKERQFTGLEAAQKVIDSGVDVVLCTTPPAFRPIHFKAAVAAGKHCFLEKPMATDAFGVRSVMETVAESKKKNLGVVAGFCWRYHPGMRETFKRLQDGAIGKILANYNTYNGGAVDRYPKFNRQNTPRDLEWQLRRWYYFSWLSGDSIVEQGCHSIDKMAWGFGDKPPLKCVANGGRQVRSGEDYGNIFDHFSVYYDYEDGVRGFHSSRQINNTAGSNIDTFYGSEGICHINGTLKQWIIKDLAGNTKWRYPASGSDDMYQIEHNEFFASIRSGNPINDGDRMATSTMLAIMGRMAAYTGAEVTWDMAMNSQDRLVPEHLDMDMKLPVAPVALPGITKFV